MAKMQKLNGHATRRAETRQQIIDATVLLIADRGVDATSVDDIATAAGIAKGSVYYNFDSKMDIVEAALEEGLARLQAMLDDASRGLTGDEALRALISGLLTQIHDHPEFAKVLAAEAFRVGREWQATVGNIRAAIMTSFQQAFEQQQRPGIDMSIVAASTFGAVLVAGLEWLVFQPNLTFEQVRDGIFDAVL